MYTVEARTVSRTDLKISMAAFNVVSKYENLINTGQLDELLAIRNYKHGTFFLEITVIFKKK